MVQLIMFSYWYQKCLCGVEGHCEKNHMRSAGLLRLTTDNGAVFVCDWDDLRLTHALTCDLYTVRLFESYCSHSLVDRRIGNGVIDLILINS